jgi:hypothetical protein
MACFLFVQVATAKDVGWASPTTHGSIGARWWAMPSLYN